MLTLVLLSGGALLLLVIVYSILQQFKQKEQANRFASMRKYKAILDEAEELLSNTAHIPFSRTLVIVLQGRILTALKGSLRANPPNADQVKQRIIDTQTQMSSVQKHYTPDETQFRMPDSDKQALQMLQIIKRLRGVTRMEYGKGKISPQAYAAEDRRLELMQLKINLANLVQKAYASLAQGQNNAAAQMFSKGLKILDGIKDKDTFLSGLQEKFKSGQSDLDEKQKFVTKEKEAKQKSQQKDELDVLFQPKKKW